MRPSYRRHARLIAALMAATVLWASVCPGAELKSTDKKPAKTKVKAASSHMDEFESEFADEQGPHVPDPFKYWNLAWFHFNDKLYFWVLKPVAQGWDAISADAVQRSVDDFLVNMAFPARFLNTLLQARPHHSGIELVRFVTNLTVGVLGFWDPATKWLDLPIYNEDFDQTLGRWYIPMGVYLTWPLFGPSSIRGTIALPIDIYTKHPLPGTSVIDQINQTALGENPYESLRQLAVDPYTSIRDAYIQSRREAILDRGQKKND